jgi:hypothetical protein
MCFNETRRNVLAHPRFQLGKALATETVRVLWIAAGEKRIGMSRLDWAAVIQPFIHDAAYPFVNYLLLILAMIRVPSG